MMQKSDQSEPVEEWMHREIKCTLYHIELPDLDRWISYVKVGDTWKCAVDTDEMDRGDVLSKTEDIIDTEMDSSLRGSVDTVGCVVKSGEDWLSSFDDDDDYYTFGENVTIGGSGFQTTSIGYKVE